MEFNGCILKIYGAVAPETPEGYVPMIDEQVFSIYVKSGFAEPCDVEIIIEGNSVALIRLEPYDYSNIEHSERVNRRFKFYEKKSILGFSRNDPNSGLIQAKFTPQYVISQPPPPLTPMTISKSISGAGGISNTGPVTNQRHTQAEPIQYDHGRAILLSVRLKADKGTTPTQNNMGNPVPPPLI